MSAFYVFIQKQDTFIEFVDKQALNEIHLNNFSWGRVIFVGSIH